MRTTEIGAWIPATGRTRGSLRPVRTMTLPSIALRRSALGEPTSPVLLRRDRRGLEAEAMPLHRLGGVEHDAVVRLAAILEREIVALECEREDR